MSTRGGGPVSLADALFQGPAPDGGLYLPASPLRMDAERIVAESRSFPETALAAARDLLGREVVEPVLEATVAEALDFPVPLRPLGDGLYVLELFHGPTLAFKDVGARFMASLMERLDPEPDRARLVLVATSGDTGSAVAHAFAGRDRFRVVVLHPRNGVSDVQRRLFSTLGGNVTAVAVEGSFDDCQRMVKGAFREPVARRLGLTAANSINVGRLLPQLFYYVDAARQGAWAGAPAFVVPSGNLGNLTAGFLAAEAGLPVRRLVAAMNANDLFHRYLEGDARDPRGNANRPEEDTEPPEGDAEHAERARSRPTLSNAMDVGDPSNLERLEALVDGDRGRLRRRVWSASFDDEATLVCMARVHEERDYLLDPHTAVGILGAEAYRTATGDTEPLVVLSTAHPAKFPDVVERAVGERPAPPPRMERLLRGEERIVPLEPDTAALMSLLRDVAGSRGVAS